MKYDLDEIRNLYATKLEEDFGEKALTTNEAMGTLDSLISSIRSSQKTLVNRIVEGEQFVHHCYGKSRSYEFSSSGYIGSRDAHPDIVLGSYALALRNGSKAMEVYEGIDAKHLEKERKEVWPGGTCNGPEFKARVFGRKIYKSYLFEMHYPDRTNDRRNGNFVRYSLLVPEDEIQEIVPKISGNPELLIDLFRKAYKGHDNSEKRDTSITLDPDHISFKDVPD